MSDNGFSHIALVVKDLDASIAFYRRYAAMTVVHRREAGGAVRAVAWLSDFTRDFALVLVESAILEDTPLGPFGHLGVACASRSEVDRLANKAQQEGILCKAPTDSGPPVGYWTYIADPDGNTLELSHGQAIAFTVKDAQRLTSED